MIGLVFWQEPFTQAKLLTLGLNKPQVLAVRFLKHNPWMDNPVYQNPTNASKRSKGHLKASTRKCETSESRTTL